MKAAKLQLHENVQALQEYAIGDNAQRPWGSYAVTDVRINAQGEDICEKEIMVNPGQVLSLQSHDMRRELWTVQAGTLTVVLDGELLTLEEGQAVHIPEQSIHCMANATNSPVIVREIQEGICREEDIVRYSDAYGRTTINTNLSANAAASLEVYKKLLQDIGQK